MKSLIELIVASWLALGAIPFIFGLLDANYKFTRCNKPLTRIEYVFPQYRVGCYLGSTPKGETE